MKASDPTTTEDTGEVFNNVDDAMAYVEDYTYDLMRIMLQHLEYDLQTKCCKLTNFADDLNELNKKFDTEENRQCLTDLLDE